MRGACCVLSALPRRPFQPGQPSDEGALSAGSMKHDMEIVATRIWESCSARHDVKDEPDNGWGDSEEALVENFVVGVDGSPEARAALTRAAKEAALHGARLTIICAWDAPLGGSLSAISSVSSPPSFDSLRDNAETVVQEAVALARELQPSVDCEGRALPGQAADVLLDQGADASLIIVGSRGRGGFARLLLGSTSQQVIQHAPCAVLVVRDGRASGTPAT